MIVKNVINLIKDRRIQHRQICFCSSKCILYKVTQLRSKLKWDFFYFNLTISIIYFTLPSILALFTINCIEIEDFDSRFHSKEWIWISRKDISVNDSNFKWFIPALLFFFSFITDDIMQESLTKFMLGDESSADKFPSKIVCHFRPVIRS